MPVQKKVVTRYSGQRIDNYLFREYRSVPKSRIYRLLRRGEIRVNGKRVKNTYRLAQGDVVRTPHIFVMESDSVPIHPVTYERVVKAIAHEDDHVIVLDKPSGLAVHGGSGIPHGVIEVLKAYSADSEIELAHRLDRDTSGCLIVAKSRAELNRLHEYFRHADVRKTYELIVVGHWPEDCVRVDLALSRYVLPSGERRVRPDDSGHPASTEIEIVQRKGEYSWLRAYPRTGRTHQIRVHAAATGHPIVGDDKYGEYGSGSGAKRMYLHAASIRLPDGRVFETPAPSEFDALWASIGEGVDS